MLPTTVRSYKSTDFGAPNLRGVAGDMVAVLDACLVNGYGSRSVQTLTRSGSTATATIAAHGYNEHDVLTVAGANQAEYNGTVRIFNVTTNTFDYEVTGTPVTPATGAVTVSKPGGGWTKDYSATNKGVYRSANVQSTRMFLRVDDTTTTYATVTGYEYMTGVDVGGGLFPIASAPLYWLKSSTADTTARAWELITDGFVFYLFVGHYASALNGHTIFAFGDILSSRQGDAFHCMIIGAPTNTAAQTPGPSTASGPQAAPSHTITAANTQMLARAYTQSGGAVDFGKIAVGHSGTNNIGDNMTQALAYPHAVDGALVATPMLVTESTAIIRGAMPGVYAPLQGRPGTRLTVLTNWPSLPGRSIWLIPLGVPNVSPAYEGRLCVDVTGPWR